MIPCHCELCTEAEAPARPRQLGQCHGYNGGVCPCELVAVPDTLLCLDHTRWASALVRTMLREFARAARK